MDTQNEPGQGASPIMAALAGAALVTAVRLAASNADRLRGLIAANGNEPETADEPQAGDGGEAAEAGPEATEEAVENTGTDDVEGEEAEEDTEPEDDEPEETDRSAASERAETPDFPVVPVRGGLFDRTTGPRSPIPRSARPAKKAKRSNRRPPPSARPLSKPTVI
jgi:hypothetical protein